MMMMMMMEMVVMMNYGLIIMESDIFVDEEEFRKWVMEWWVDLL